MNDPRQELMQIMYPPQITDYEVVCASAVEVLNIEVNRLIQEGYEIDGPLMTQVTDNVVRFIQPMGKYEDIGPQPPAGRFN